MNWNWITQRLATGELIADRNAAQYLAGQGITHIVNCHTRDESDLVRDLPLAYLHCPTEDDGQPKGAEWFRPGIAFVLNALACAPARIRAPLPGGASPTRIYVHCAMGYQRGPSMLYAALRALGLSPALAEKLVRTGRPGVGLCYQRDADRAIKQLGYEAANEPYLPSMELA